MLLFALACTSEQPNKNKNKPVDSTADTRTTGGGTGGTGGGGTGGTGTGGTGTGGGTGCPDYSGLKDGRSWRYEFDYSTSEMAYSGWTTSQATLARDGDTVVVTVVSEMGYSTSGSGYWTEGTSNVVQTGRCDDGGYWVEQTESDGTWASSSGAGTTWADTIYDDDGLLVTPHGVQSGSQWTVVSSGTTTSGAGQTPFSTSTAFEALDETSTTSPAGTYQTLRIRSEASSYVQVSLQDKDVGLIALEGEDYELVEVSQ